MELILSAGIGIGILMFMLLLFKKNKIKGDFFFLFFILTILLQIIFYELTIYQYDLHGLLGLLGFALPLLSSPLLFIYILTLTGQKIRWFKMLIHLSIYFIYILIFLLFNGNLDLIASKGILLLPENSKPFMQLYAVPMAVSGLIYSILDLLLLKKHQNKISEIFSFREKVNLKWVRYLVFSFFGIFLISSLIIFGSTRFQLLSIDLAFTLVGISLSIFLAAFGFYGLKQTAVFVDTQLEKSSHNQKAYVKSGLTSKKIKETAVQIEKIMQAEKPYLNDELTLHLLAEKCGQTTAHLSQIINQHFQMNFYDYVNRYRVEEAKKKLSSSDFNHLSVLGIAFECGFKSKSSFNRYFKKYTGSSPSEFKNKLDE